ncbi:MAG: DUF480 domain-containing protein, partial [Acidobacteria bacterium]|nr:DUF480 domain-containing protein [Acidobacteriota bacterium]
YLSRGDEALVRELQRRPGQKENRWTHLAGGAVSEEEAPAAPVAVSLTSRVEQLESEVEQLRAQLEALRDALGEK